MFKSLAFYIGLRYTRAKKRNGFVSFISLASMLGIALGVTVLITALSVMNGFNYQIKSRFFALIPQIQVLTGSNIESNWKGLAKKIESISQVSTVAPFSSGKAIIMKDGQVYGVEVKGIIPKEEIKVSKLNQKIVKGSLQTIDSPGHYNIIIGKTLADDLNVSIGDKITLFMPGMSISLAGVFPHYRRFTVTGIFHGSDAFAFDLTYAYVNIGDAERIFPAGNKTNGLDINLHDMYQVGTVSEQIQNLLPPGYIVTNWTRSNGAFFQAIYMEKTILFVILLLIIAVAAFNLVATLVMVVNDKRADIAILRTLGARPGTILRTFIVQGLVIGVIGTIIGLICGLLLAHFATDIVSWYQTTFHVKLLQESVFFVNYLPSRIQAGDVILVSIVAIVLSLLAALYPAWLAFRTQPAEALRYE